jgi:hypothetical protein
MKKRCAEPVRIPAFREQPLAQQFNYAAFFFPSGIAPPLIRSTSR